MTASDPVCPACGEPVGSTSTYCMHCDAEFDALTDRGTPDERAMPAAGGRDSTTSGRGRATGNRDADGPSVPHDAGRNGRLRAVGAKLVGVALVVTVGLLSVFILVGFLSEWTTLALLVALVGLAATAGAAVAIWGRPTGRDALARSLYVVAVASVVRPFAFSTLTPNEGSIGLRLVAGTVGSFVGALFGVPAGLLGYWLHAGDE